MNESIVNGMYALGSLLLLLHLNSVGCGSVLFSNRICIAGYTLFFGATIFAFANVLIYQHYFGVYVPLHSRCYFSVSEFSAFSFFQKFKSGIGFFRFFANVSCHITNSNIDFMNRIGFASVFPLFQFK